MTLEYTDVLGSGRITPISNGAPSTACFLHFPAIDWGIARLVGQKSSYERVGENLLAHNFMANPPGKFCLFLTAMVVAACTGLLLLLGIALVRDAHAHLLAVCVAITCTTCALYLTWIRRVHNPS